MDGQRIVAGVLSSQDGLPTPHRAEHPEDDPLTQFIADGCWKADKKGLQALFDHLEYGLDQLIAAQAACKALMRVEQDENVEDMIKHGG